MSEELHKISITCKDQNSWGGEVNYEWNFAEHDLQQLRDAIDAKLEELQEQRRRETPLYRFAMRLATFGWGGDVTLTEAWAQTGEESRKIYLRQAQEFIAAGWTIDAAPPLVMFAAESVPFNKLADYLQKEMGACTVAPLSVKETWRTIAAKSLRFVEDYINDGEDDE